MKKVSIIVAIIGLLCAHWTPSNAAQFSMEGYWETKRGRSYEATGLGVPDSDYQKAFNVHARHGFELFLVDGYDLEGRTYMNFVFRTATGTPWRARHGLNASAYQQEFDKQVKHGPYCLRWVDSYLKGHSIRYAVVFTRNNCRGQVAYHGYSPSQHQKRFENLSKNGWSPVNVSVASVNGNRYYTAFYEKRRGGHLLKTFLTRDQFARLNEQQKKAGRRLAYMNAYIHDKGVLPRFVGIWNSKVSGGEYLPNVYGPKMMDQGNRLGKKGYYVRFVTGYGVGSGHRFDAFWYKPRRGIAGPGSMSSN